jgi:hypothetical protein
LPSDKENEKLVYIHAMKASMGVEVQLLSFLTSALVEGE